MIVLTKARSRPEGSTNPFKLPRGEAIRKALVRIFRRQRNAILRYARTGKKDQGPPNFWPDFHDFGLGAIDIADQMTPLLTLIWDAAGDKFAPQVGLDPNVWSVVNPNTERVIAEAAFLFCDSTNATTSQALQDALVNLRTEMTTGIVTQGEALTELTKRVNAIFDQAETWRARRIAWTETSRAVHAAQEQAAIASGVVTGWKWLLSSDACPMCVAVAARCPEVRLGQAFAVIGAGPYSQVRFPPLHPHCNCSLIEVLDTDDQPQWGITLQDPEPATDEEAADVAAEIAARDEATQLGKRVRPDRIKRMRPLARKRLRKVEIEA